MLLHVGFLTQNYSQCWAGKFLQPQDSYFDLHNPRAPNKEEALSPVAGREVTRNAFTGKRQESIEAGQGKSISASQIETHRPC